jgi:hypothetical protein
LALETRNLQVNFKPIFRLEDCAGIFAGHADIVELKKEIDKSTRNTKREDALENRFLIENYTLLALNLKLL